MGSDGHGEWEPLANVPLEMTTSVALWMGWPGLQSECLCGSLAEIILGYVEIAQIEADAVMRCTESSLMVHSHSVFTFQTHSLNK